MPVLLQWNPQEDTCNIKIEIRFLYYLSMNIIVR